jgi:hypothetical protein
MYMITPKIDWLINHTPETESAVKEPAFNKFKGSWNFTLLFYITWKSIPRL